jgi:LacI family transcriptional regulator
VAGGTAAAIELLAAHPHTTAVVAFNDLMAIGAIRALRAQGRRVPEDCAVTGFDDLSLAAHLDPPLTTVHTDKYELGRTLVDVLSRELGSRPAAGDGAAEARVLPATLVVRASG